VVFHAIGATAADTAATIKPAQPAGTAVGDLMIMIISADGNDVLTLPSGWTKFIETDNTTALRSTMAWAIATTTNTQKNNVTGASNCVIAAIASFGGVATTSPINNSSSLPNASSATIATTGITPTATGTMILFGAHYSDNPAYSGYSGTDLNFTEILDDGSTSGADCGLALAYSSLMASTTNIGGRTATAGSCTGCPTVNNGSLIAINPAPTLEQRAYRWFSNLNSPAVGAASTINTPAIAPPQGTPFRLRMLLHFEGVGQLNSGATTTKLQFAQRSGTCDTSFTGESWTDVGDASSTAISYWNNPNTNGSVPDDAPLTPGSEDPRYPTTTVGLVTSGVSNFVVNFSYEEKNNASNTANIVGGAGWPLGLFFS